MDRDLCRTEERIIINFGTPTIAATGAICEKCNGYHRDVLGSETSELANTYEASYAERSKNNKRRGTESIMYPKIIYAVIEDKRVIYTDRVRRCRLNI